MLRFNRPFNAMVSESEIIKMIRSRARPGAGVVLGVGDDAAVVKSGEGKDILACCDLLVEGVHFRSAWGAERLIGRKALAVNLSDIAAMGGVPRFAMISVALPPGSSGEFVESLFDGIFELADATRVSIIGGDTSSSPGPLFLDVSVIGECDAGSAVTRSGARPGDVVYVTGSLGASALGLRLLEEHAGPRGMGEGTTESLTTVIRWLSGAGTVTNSGQDSMASWSAEALAKHLKPEPRLQFGAALGERKLASAMIDVSDGLSTDLGHILEESQCGAIIRAEAIPVAECVRRSSLPAEVRIEPLDLALHGGEEYELLFTAVRENEARIADAAREAGLTVTRIGEIVGERELKLERDGETRKLEAGGYQHMIA
jgi:thiamine-monophosphate kinase